MTVHATGMRMRFLILWFAGFVLLAGSCGLVLFAVHAALPPAEQAQFAGLLARESKLIFALVAIIFAASGFLADGLVRLYVAPVHRLAESTRLIAQSNPGFRTEASGPSEMRELSQAIDALAARHEALLDTVEDRVRQASTDLDEEKNRLAALMSELGSGVIVCNAGFRILLYNEHARRLFSGRGATGFIGLGRSLFSLLDRELIAHGIEQLRYRMAQGEARPVTGFMASLANGVVIRGRIAPVGGPLAPGPAPPDILGGIVLLLDDVAKEVALADQHDRLLRRLIESVRASLGSMRAAAENLENFPDMDAARRAQFTALISAEAHRLTDEINQTTRLYSDFARSQWSPEQMRAADLVAILAQRVVTQIGIRAEALPVAGSTWVNVDSYSLAQCVCSLARRLNEEFGIHEITFHAAPAGRHVHLDLAWKGARLPAAKALAWETAAFDSAGEAGPHTLQEVVRRHGGEAWYENDPAGERAWFRLLLPAAEPAVAPPPPHDSRPEYYDFDLFNQPGQTRDLDDHSLRELAYTVFDTETTGLAPSRGDEIISIGAVRLVNGRLLTGEVFDRLVDPRRPINREAIKIHGIRSEMLAGQPTIEKVLPEFHRFCEDTVLVGHNAAFDMRFLQLKETATGIRFTQPVLDTLLLSAALHPNLGEHELESIAARLGVNVTGRHTALGDAFLTGEIFLRMIPLLEERGVATLGQALEASRRTLHARIRY